jgi:hypothetical protein
MASKVIDGYTYSLSDKKNKKLKVVVDGKTIHFGGDPLLYQHFKDRTGLLPKSQNHGDDKRRLAYLNRSTKIKDSTGFAYLNPKSPAYHALRILW